MEERIGCKERKRVEKVERSRRMTLGRMVSSRGTKTRKGRQGREGRGE